MSPLTKTLKMLSAIAIGVVVLYAFFGIFLEVFAAGMPLDQAFYFPYGESPSGDPTTSVLCYSPNPVEAVDMTGIYILPRSFDIASVDYFRGPGFSNSLPQLPTTASINPGSIGGGSETYGGSCFRGGEDHLWGSVATAGGGTLGDGDFWLVTTRNGTDDSNAYALRDQYVETYAPFSIVSGAIVTISDESTRVVSVNSPTEGQSFAVGDPIPWSLTVFVGDPPVNQFRLQFRNTTFQTFVGTEPYELVEGSNTISGTSTAQFVQGVWTVNAFLNQIGADGLTEYGILESNLSTFSVGATSSVDIVGVDLDNPYDILNQLDLATTTCSLGSADNIVACGARLAIAILWPSASSTERLMRIKDLVTTKPPIGYFYAVRDQIGGISTTTTPIATTTVPDGIKNTFFTPLNTAISGILWFFGIRHLWSRVTKVETK